MSFEKEIKNIEFQIEILKSYAQIMLDREDYHGLWDAAIDLARLTDKIELIKNIK